MAKVVLSAHDQKESYEKGQPNMFLDTMLRKFKKQVEAEDILGECKRREFFLKKSLRRREKAKRAKIRDIKANKKRKRL